MLILLADSKGLDMRKMDKNVPYFTPDLKNLLWVSWALV